MFLGCLSSMPACESTMHMKSVCVHWVETFISQRVIERLIWSETQPVLSTSRYMATPDGATLHCLHPLHSQADRTRHG